MRARAIPVHTVACWETWGKYVWRKRRRTIVLSSSPSDLQRFCRIHSPFRLTPHQRGARYKAPGRPPPFGTGIVIAIWLCIPVSRAFAFSALASVHLHVCAYYTAYTAHRHTVAGVRADTRLPPALRCLRSNGERRRWLDRIPSRPTSWRRFLAKVCNKPNLSTRAERQRDKLPGLVQGSVVWEQVGAPTCRAAGPLRLLCRW